MLLLIALRAGYGGRRDRCITAHSSHARFEPSYVPLILRYSWPTSAPPCSLGRRLPPSVRDQRLRSKTRYTCRSSRTGTDRASSVRLTSFGPCHRRVSSDEHPIRRALRSWLRVQLRALGIVPKSCGASAPPDLRPPVARGSWSVPRVPPGRGQSIASITSFAPGGFR